MVCLKLLSSITGLLTIAEARTEARTGFLRVESRPKVGDQENWFVGDIFLWKVGVE